MIQAQSSVLSQIKLKRETLFFLCGSNCGNIRTANDYNDDISVPPKVTGEHNL